VAEETRSQSREWEGIGEQARAEETGGWQVGKKQQILLCCRNDKC